MKKFWIQLTAAAAALVLLFGYNSAILAKEEAKEETVSEKSRTDSADSGTENVEGEETETGKAESEETEAADAESMDAQSPEADSGNAEDESARTDAGAESGDEVSADAGSKNAQTASGVGEDSAYADGTYQGTGEGYGGEITVEVTVEGGSIESVTVISAKEEDAAYFNTAKGIIEDILEKQSADVDTVSGATYSSAGIRDAVSAALEEAEP